MNILARSLLIIFVTIACLPASAQDTTRQVPPDSTNVDPNDSLFVEQDGKIIPIESYASKYDPRRAILLAAVFPGAGQVYNKKYWKLPLVYGGFAGIGYAIWWNQDRYLFYRKGLFSLLNEPASPVADADGNTPLGNKLINGKVYYPLPNNGFLSADVARTAVNKFRRDRDFALIMSFIFYMMQMVDAHVDAHLKEFDLNPQLKVSIEPTINQNAFIGRTTGFGLTLKF